MKLIERANINTLKWDALVKEFKGDVFSYSWYLDALAENWCIIVDDYYTSGIVIPYTNKLGVKMGYIPVFSRSIEWFGTEEEQSKAIKLIESSFHGYDLRLRERLVLQNETELVYQVLPSLEPSFGSQAKRMLNKATKNNYVVEESLELEFALTLIEN